MYIHRIIKKNKKKTYKTILLQRSYRDKEKGPRQITIANLSEWPEELVNNFEKILNGGKVIDNNDLLKIMNVKQGKAYGAIKTVSNLCDRLGISAAIKDKRRLFLTKIIIAGFLIGKYSKNYIANEWSKLQAIPEALETNSYWNEDDLYETLEWLNEHQRSIEKKIFRHKHKKSINTKMMFLYDVTGSYVEGGEMDLTAFGYQRDGKPGKEQIVIGMMSDSEGDPVCIEVFKGNTLDYKTVKSQLEKIKKEYCVDKIIFVGDRGMIKSSQIEAITDEKWEYITAITKPQIEKMIKDDIIQYSLFDEELCEVSKDNIRYILKKNPIRAEEIKRNFNDKLARFEQIIKEKNQYLAEHKKGLIEAAEKKIVEYIKTRKLGTIINLTQKDRFFSFTKNEDAITESLKLAGCYVIKTNVPESELSKKQAHDSYKNLSKVEHAFKIIKTSVLNIRPLYVRLESHIRGHVFCCMLALKIALYLERELKPLEFTLQYCLESLNAIHTCVYSMDNQTFIKLPDKFSDDNELILKTLELNWNKVL
jgi:transposase